MNVSCGRLLGSDQDRLSIHLWEDYVFCQVFGTRWNKAYCQTSIHYKNLQQKLIALLHFIALHCIALDWIGKMSGSMSGRDLMVVSMAAALGGGLVAALAFNAGSHFASGDCGGGGGGSCERRSLECFNKFLPRWFWLQWVRVCLILLHTLIDMASVCVCMCWHFVVQCVFGFLRFRVCSGF